MAIAAPVNQNPDTFKHGVCISSVKGAWATCHADAKTAQSASDLIRPGAVTASGVTPIALNQGTTRALFRVRYGAAQAITTSPVIRVIACYGAGLISSTTPTLPDDGSMRYVLLASTQTLAGAPTTDVRDTTYSYSAPLSLTGTDLLGADYLLVFIETAMSVTGAAIIECLLLN